MLRFGRVRVPSRQKSCDSLGVDLLVVCGDEEWSSAIDDSSGSFFQEFVIRTGRFGGRVMRFVAPES